MGLFDGYLFCSDIDGTLVEGTVVSRENLEAIDYFKREGGHFVIATGRYADYPKQTLHIDPDGPIISLNGTLIVDSRTRENMAEFPLTPTEMTVAAALAADGWEHIDCACLYWVDHDLICRSPEALRSALREAETSGETVYKVVFAARSEADAIALRTLGQVRFDGQATLCRTWNMGVELYRIHAGKAACMQCLRRILPGITKTVAVGDYENDALMIAAADYGYCPAGAAPEALRAARYRAPACRDHAIAYIVSELEKERTKGKRF